MTMLIDVPTWAFVLGCIFGFVGVVVTLVLIYGIIVSAFTPYHYDDEEELKNEQKQDK